MFHIQSTTRYHLCFMWDSCRKMCNPSYILFSIRWQ